MILRMQVSVIQLVQSYCCIKKEVDCGYLSFCPSGRVRSPLDPTDISGVEKAQSSVVAIVPELLKGPWCYCLSQLLLELGVGNQLTGCSMCILPGCWLLVKFFPPQEQWAKDGTIFQVPSFFLIVPKLELVFLMVQEPLVALDLLLSLGSREMQTHSSLLLKMHMNSFNFRSHPVKWETKTKLKLKKWNCFN